MEREGSLLGVVCLVAGMAAFCCSGEAAARQNVVIGGAGIGYDYWDRSYDNEAAVIGDEGDRRELSVWPEIELQSSGIHDSLTLHYSPVLTYDDIDSETDVDHYLDLDWTNRLTRQWSLDISNYFVLSSDPTRYDMPFATEAGESTAEEDTPPATEGLTQGGDLTQNLGSRRYWSNRLDLLTSYAYAADSDVEFGYNLRILRNEDSDEFIEYDEYDRHGLVGAWTHSYTPNWSTQLGLGYYKGEFKNLGAEGLTQDLQEYRANAEIAYSTAANSSFPLGYRYQKADYKDLRDDVWGHEMTLSWEHVFDSRNELIIGAGPSYAETDDLSGDFDVNYHVNYIRTYQHGTVEALVDKRYLSQHYTGITDTGLVDTTDVRLDFYYRMRPDIVLNLFGLYRYEEILNPTGRYYEAALGAGDPAAESDIGDITYTRDAYWLGASVSYTFLRWFTTSLGYEYYQREGDVETDSYDDHRIMLTLTARKDLWR